MWVETGAWPLPEAVRAMTLYFMMSDLECWLESGTWPDHVHFRVAADQRFDRQSLEDSAAVGLPKE
jgi:hypothetical protein